jgi:phenylacetate-CoA ligase
MAEKRFPKIPRPLRLMNLLVHTRSSPAAIQRIQERKLRVVVDDACRHVPFYRELYRKAGIATGAIRSLADLPRLPLTVKKDLLDQPLAEVLANGVDPATCLSSSSSGSSGAPLTAYWNPRDRAAMNLSWKRAYLASGLRPRERVAAFIGRQHCDANVGWHERLGFFPRLEISSWLDPQQWVDMLRAWRPQAISGYVMTLRILADFLIERGITDVRPRLLFHTSALLDDASRDLFSRVFNCRVIDIYGSEEAGCIGWECPICEGYHVAADMLIVEVLKDGRPAQPGEQGEVVITNLNSRVMPFIRYRQGDMVTVSRRQPRCGNPFPLIERIEGRLEDFLVLRNGRRMPPHPFYHCIDPVPGIRRWRIVQETAGAMRLELVATEEFAAASLKKIISGLTALTLGQIEVDIATVGDIPVTPSRKFRTISSRVGKLPQ